MCKGDEGVCKGDEGVCEGDEGVCEGDGGGCEGDGGLFILATQAGAKGKLAPQAWEQPLFQETI